jgi:hypothetical protein
MRVRCDPHGPVGFVAGAELAMIDAFLLAFGTLVAGVGVSVATAGVVYGLLRMLGFGACWRCRRTVSMRELYCHEHGLS